MVVGARKGGCGRGAPLSPTGNGQARLPPQKKNHTHSHAKNHTHFPQVGKGRGEDEAPLPTSGQQGAEKAPSPPPRPTAPTGRVMLMGWWWCEQSGCGVRAGFAEESKGGEQTRALRRARETASPCARRPPSRSRAGRPAGGPTGGRASGRAGWGAGGLAAKDLGDGEGEGLPARGPRGASGQPRTRRWATRAGDYGPCGWASSGHTSPPGE